MENEKGLRRYLSPAGAWAFSIGTSIGWGSLVVTASTYLAQAGPLGSVLGLAAGALVMLVIGWSYAYLTQCYPEAGGAYAFAREAFGYDQAFLTAWFLAITYFAILWANATSLPLFGRIFLGDVFRFGRLYSLFGYDVYLGEALLSCAALALFALLCMRSVKLIGKLMIGLAALFAAAILFCFAGALLGGARAGGPAFVPDASALAQVVRIAVISPWAFIGFESVSHSAEEFDFERKKLRRVLLISVVSTLALYLAVTLLSVMAYPPEYESWLAYIRDLDSLEGLRALPAFYAADRFLGGLGVALLTLALLALVITSLIGNMTALSRLIYALGRENVLPARYAHLNDQGAPDRALLLVAGVSMLIPLAGRTAIGWIVDVTTIGATLIYSFVSAAAARVARKTGGKREMLLGRAGLAVMVIFGLYFLLPNLVDRGSLATETYFLFIAWSVLGFLVFHSLLRRDKTRRFGTSGIVWVVILALVLLVSLIWMRQSMIASNDNTIASVRAYYSDAEGDNLRRAEDERYIEEQVAQQRGEEVRTMMIAMGMFAFALVIMLTNHSYTNKRSLESERMANTDPLTGVRNKLAYLVQEKTLDAALAENREQQFGIVVCDLNGLKKINDTLGHKAGDDYIRQACRMICDIFQHSSVFRVGGDEFAVILKDRDYAARGALVTTVHDRSAENIRLGGAVVSAGMAEYRPGEDKSAHDVFARADQLMYEEKKLLKGLGAEVREDAEEQPAVLPESARHDPILNVKRQVLIAEDEFVSQQILGNALEREYQVLYAQDGLEAMELLHQHKDSLALMLLDLNMPGLSGMELLKRMQDSSETRHIPVIVLTAERGAEVACLRLGAMDFIPKPYPSMEVILARVSKCIELSEDRELIHFTERDSLTGLFNIDYFFRYVKLFDQHFVEREMDAVAVDINHFSMLNERYGKHFGNAVLREIGEGIRGVARETDGVGCRSSMDIFYIYCPHRDDYPAVLEKISASLAGDETAEGRVRLRLGVYERVDKTMGIERRFECARAAADSVKNSFQNAVGIYRAEMREAELLKDRLCADFRPCLEEGRFTIFFQPKFDIRQDTPALASAEALARWDHPELGMISPAVFIPILEENGLSLELDRYVWRRAAAQIRDWKDRLGVSVPVSVNVSRIDMLTPNLKDIFVEILEDFSLTAHDLVLEITEAAYTGNSEHVISTVKDLRAMGLGFRIEMDDFGAGYSSLEMLTRLPIDALKLDMNIVRGAFADTGDMRMVELIIDIAEYLHVPVVAEGVETEKEYRALKKMGCDMVQGYYFSRPVPAAKFERFLTQKG